MDPISITLIVLGGLILGGAVLMMWPYIATAIAMIVIPGVRKILGNTIADGLAQLVGWVDGKVTLVNHQVLKLYRSFSSSVVWAKQKIVGKGNTATIDTEVYVQEGTKFRKVISTDESIPLDQLPQEVREKVLNNQQHEVDLKQAFEQQVKTRAKEMSMSL